MESRRRSSRSVAEKHDPKDLKANGGFGSTGQVGTSSDDENEDDTAAPSRATQRTPTRRQHNRVDLSRLEAPSLRKYRRVYKLGEVQNGGTKEELMPAVARHWNQTIVDEDETLVAFAFALRKQATTGSGASLGVNRTTAMKPSSARSLFKAKGK
mmetsp:Transcript_15140/g.36649  ORF Transcript_15140/g.36649 Transcript_15140/m.36649 type:complete len:155 (+) Transcript_15140:242-706(+)